jgi:hypothetical protein
MELETLRSHVVSLQQKIDKISVDDAKAEAEQRALAAMARAANPIVTSEPFGPKTTSSDSLGADLAQVFSNPLKPSQPTHLLSRPVRGMSRSLPGSPRSLHPKSISSMANVADPPAGSQTVPKGYPG